MATNQDVCGFCQPPNQKPAIGKLCLSRELIPICQDCQNAYDRAMEQEY